MRYLFKDALGGQFNLYYKEGGLNQALKTSTNKETLSIAWNKGDSQQIKIEGIDYIFPANAVIPLMAGQEFQFFQASSIVLWRFNREFYCIFEHDKEVSCSGFLFYGMHDLPFIYLEEEDQEKLNQLQDLFIEEFNFDALLKGEMLRLLLKSLLIKLTRLARKQYFGSSQLSECDFDTIRSFNLLVETHFKKYHLVKQYAGFLNISPKTLSNLLNQHSQYSALQVIHNRIILEAKRMLFYTNKQTKEIAYDLGFMETSHFSRFFKNQTGLSPQFYKVNLKKNVLAV